MSSISSRLIRSERDSSSPPCPTPWLLAPVAPFVIAIAAYPLAPFAKRNRRSPVRVRHGHGSTRARTDAPLCRRDRRDRLGGNRRGLRGRGTRLDGTHLLRRRAPLCA